MYDSSMVSLAPGTSKSDEIALVPPPLETNVILNGELWIFFTMSVYLFNLISKIKDIF